MAKHLSASLTAALAVLVGAGGADGAGRSGDRVHILVEECAEPCLYPFGVKALAVQTSVPPKEIIRIRLSIDGRGLTPRADGKFTFDFFRGEDGGYARHAAEACVVTRSDVQCRARLFGLEEKEQVERSSAKVWVHRIAGGSSEFVSGLTKEDFRIRRRGVEIGPSEIDEYTLSPASYPGTCLLFLADVSGSIASEFSRPGSAEAQLLVRTEEGYDFSPMVKRMFERIATEIRDSYDPAVVDENIGKDAVGVCAFALDSACTPYVKAAESATLVPLLLDRIRGRYAEVEDAIAGNPARAGELMPRWSLTALYFNMEKHARILSDLTPACSRKNKVLVILTDGIDTWEKVGFDADLLGGEWIAKRAWSYESLLRALATQGVMPVPVYEIHKTTSPRQTTGYLAKIQLFQRSVEKSGGQVLKPGAKSVERLLAEAVLRESMYYEIFWDPRGLGGGDLEIRVAREGVQVTWFEGPEVRRFDNQMLNSVFRRAGLDNNLEVLYAALAVQRGFEEGFEVPVSRGAMRSAIAALQKISAAPGVPPRPFGLLIGEIHLALFALDAHELKSGDRSRRSGALKDLAEVFVPKETALRLVDLLPDDDRKRICSGRRRPGTATWIIGQEVCRGPGGTVEQ